MVISKRKKRKPSIDFFDLMETNLINTLTVFVKEDLMKEFSQRVVKEK